MPIVLDNIDREATLMTDDNRVYRTLGKEFAAPHVINHTKGHYGRGMVYTNTVEGFFSIFKRGMRGVYQHCGEQHLHRYLAEFDFRYSNRAALEIDDAERAGQGLQGIAGKRLTYRRTDGLHAQG